MTSTILIARPHQTPSRVFPAIATDFYPRPSETSDDETLSLDQQAAHFLLSLANYPLTQKQLLFAHKLGPQELLARLLIQHRMGFEAELAAQWQRADFYWQQVQNQFKALKSRTDVWDDLTADLKQRYENAEVLIDPDRLKQRLVEELLIDTHCGFYNGLVSIKKDQTAEEVSDRSAAPYSRAFAHITFLEGLLPDSSLVQEDWLTILAPAWQHQLDQFRQNQSWKQAIRLCQHRLKFYPKSIPFQTDLAEVQGAEILSGLKKSEKEAQALANARHLKKSIQTFSRLAQTYPHNPVFHQYLGNLHHLHAIQLGNGLQVAEGLVAIEKALIFMPHLEAALTTRNQLVQTMDQIQNQVGQMLAELKRRPGAKLNAQGQRLQTQAKKGVTLRDNYLRSPQAAADQAARTLAQAMEIWRRIPGLPPEPTNQQCLALNDSLAQIIQQPPLDKAGLLDEWQRIGQAKSELANLPTPPICAFLEQRIWEKRIPEPIITPLPSLQNPATIHPTQQQPQPSHEPLLPWLFSRQHLWLKSQVALAIATLFTAGALGLYEWSIRTTRTRAYQEILTAASQNQLETVMNEAETFLSRKPLSGKDVREDQVRRLYDEAFVNWFMQQPNLPEDSIMQQYTQQYKRLMKE